ncbi:MAG: hypothetical protein AAF362_00945 [Pseudomonadota bacterium]
MRTLEMVRSSGKIDRQEAGRKRAALLTAQAMEEEPAHPEKAVKHAKEAIRLAPDLVPAAVVGASAMVRHNDLRRAAKMLEAAWKKQPHPDIASAYVNLRSGDSVIDRLNRAQKLAGMAPDSAEGNMAVAQAAIAAQEYEKARKAMDPVIADGPTQRACVIMADLEEAEYGDRGRMRDWLARAVRAPHDPAWIADGRVSARWLPVSPLTGEIDAFHWAVPEDQPAGDIGAVFEPEVLRELIQPLGEPVDLNEAVAENGSDPVPDDAGEIIEVVAEEKPAEEEPAREEAVEDVAPAETGEPETVDAEAKGAEPSGEEHSETTEPSTDKPKEDEAESKAVSEEDSDEKSDAPEDAEETDNVFPLKRLPDDPGVDEDEVEEKKGFKLF